MKVQLKGGGYLCAGSEGVVPLKLATAINCNLKIFFYTINHSVRSMFAGRAHLTGGLMKQETLEKAKELAAEMKELKNHISYYETAKFKDAKNITLHAATGSFHYLPTAGDSITAVPELETVRQVYNETILAVLKNTLQKVEKELEDLK